MFDVLQPLLKLFEPQPGDAIAIEDERGRARTWSYIRELTTAAAGTLGTMLAPGDRVGLLLEPGAEWLAAFFGILRAGCVVVPLQPRYPDREIAGLLENAGASLLVCDEPRGLACTRLTRDELFAGSRGAVRSSSLAMLLYTSGTTGRPKGAMLTHQNLASGVTAVTSAWQLSGRRALLHALPLHHLHGIAVALLPCLAAGMRVRMLPAFDAVKVWEALGEVDTLMAVPTMYHRMLAAHAAADAATRERWGRSARALGLATSGSAALPESIAAAWAAIAGAIPLERWGMTEVGVGLSSPLDPARRRRGRVGTPFGEMAVRIDEEGELWVRGPTVFSGYFGRAEAVLEDGWFRTGDIAERDEEGSYRILGRRSVDIIKSGGFKISALEIEECLRDHPSIDDIAVVGIPDEAYGERVAAAVVPRGALSIEELTAFARDRLAAYKIPRVIELMEALPRNAVGKVEKPRVVALLTADRSRG